MTDRFAPKPDTRLLVGDCREILPGLQADHARKVDLIFADPPFNWNVKYDTWVDGLSRREYLRFTREWLDRCVVLLRPGGSFWINIPDDTAAEIVVHLKRRGLEQRNWCVWHYRFGQNAQSRFIGSKTHVLYFVMAGQERTWNPDTIRVATDRATKYNDSRTTGKSDGSPDGQRLPFDVWGVEGDGKYWGRVQGNNRERRPVHANQLPEVYLERVIRACSNPGDLVLDPFCGSGTTSTVARALNRRSITIEVSPQTADSAWDRIVNIGAVRIAKAAVVRKSLMPGVSAQSLSINRSSVPAEVTLWGAT